MLIFFVSGLVVGALIGIEKGISDVSIISMLASALATIIAIPVVVAHYLFNKNEDDKILSYMEKMAERGQPNKSFSKEEAKAVISGIVEIKKGELK